MKFTGVTDAAFDEEKTWLEAELAGVGNEKEVVDEEKEAVDAVMDDDGEEEEDGNGIECQCCFADYPFVRSLMIHLSSSLTLSPPTSPKWFNVPKLTSSAQPASPHTHPPD